VAALRRFIAPLLAVAAVAGPAVAQDRPLAFGVLNQQSAVLTAERWNPILHYLSSVSGVPLQLRMGPTVQDTNAMMARGDFDFVFTNHNFQSEFDHIGFRVLARWGGDILDAHGYAVLEAGDAEEAWTIFERHPERIDLLLTDVVVPKASGRELADRMTAARPDLPVLYMSGYTDQAIVHRGVLEEGIAYLEKPFTMETVTRAVRSVIDAQPVGSASV
jgi:CheY-like chemotaxis protein